jgi:hypothetical protein
MPEINAIPSEFWEASDYATENYVSAPFDEAMLQSVQLELGYTLPASYLALMRTQNGGMPQRTCHPTTSGTSWADDHVALTGIYGIGRGKPYSLCGEMSSRFWSEEWGYPKIGVYFADCPSAGHDMLCLDYSLCGPHGEPRVVHIDQEFDYKITVLAASFQEFVLGLRLDEEYDQG